MDTLGKDILNQIALILYKRNALASLSNLSCVSQEFNRIFSSYFRKLRILYSWIPDINKNIPVNFCEYCGSKIIDQIELTSIRYDAPMKLYSYRSGIQYNILYSYDKHYYVCNPQTCKEYTKAIIANIRDI